MMPSAKIAIRLRPPPLNVFSRPRMLPLPKLDWMSLTACAFTPGTGMCEPRRYSARSSAVNASFLRMSATVKALRIVDSMRGPERLAGQNPFHGPAAALGGPRVALQAHGVVRTHRNRVELE